MVYTQRGPIRPPPPRYKKNWLGSGVKVEISCPLRVWDLAQQTIGINLVAVQHASRVGGFIPFGVQAAAVYADTFSKQHFDGRVRQKVKLSLYAFPFMCLSVFPL